MASPATPWKKDGPRISPSTRNNKDKPMPIVNRVSDLHADIAAWRQDIHAHPELLYDVFRTASVVEEKLRAFGCDEVVTGLGDTGVVGVIHGRLPATGAMQVIGLRADMDALPIEEDTGLPYQSTIPGKMHACGHDGHTAMLLGAARYLAETRNFAGTAIVIFQPAEEGGNGAERMIRHGLIERFGIQQVYGMHNRPGLPLGQFSIRTGPSMASTDRINIEIEGKGGHAARPHAAIDSLLVGTQLVGQLQSIVSRSVDPLESAVVSICEFHAGNAHNVIPQKVQLSGTVRTLKAEIRDLVEKRDARGGRWRREDDRRADRAQVSARGRPVLVNHDAQVDIAARVAAEIVGEQNVLVGVPPVMGGEDFAFMLQERPRRLHQCRQRRQRATASPGLQFQRRSLRVPAPRTGSSWWKARWRREGLEHGETCLAQSNPVILRCAAAGYAGCAFLLKDASQVNPTCDALARPSKGDGPGRASFEARPATQLRRKARTSG